MQIGNPNKKRRFTYDRSRRTDDNKSPSSVRIRSTVKLVGSIVLFLWIATSGLGSFVTTAALMFILYPCWKFIPEIATGVTYDKVSDRAIGVTILLGGSLLLVSIIVLFVMVLPGN